MEQGEEGGEGVVEVAVFHRITEIRVGGYGIFVQKSKKIVI